MYCQNCGNFNSDDSVFCGECGAGLEKTDEITTSEKVKHTPEEQTAPEGKSRPNINVSKTMAFIVAEAVVLFLIIFGVIKFGKICFEPERVASNYFVNMANGDWKEAYDKLDVDESEFINRKMFILTNQNNEMGKVSNFLAQNPSNEIENILNGSSGLGTVVDIEYRTKGSNSNSDYEVVLNKQAKKQFFFFDNWRVSTQNLIYKDYCISVPKDAVVVLDGKTLDSKFLDSDTSENEYGEGVENYVIPQIFGGTHTIEVSKEDYKEIVDLVEVDYDASYYTVDNLQLKDEVVQQLMQSAGEDMQTIYSAAMTGKDFTTIQDMFATDCLEEAERDYNLLLSSLVMDENRGIEKVDFRNIRTTAYTDATVVSIEADYNVQSFYKNFWNEEINRNNSDFSDVMRFEFKKENDKWVLTNLGCNDLYYY